MALPAPAPIGSLSEKEKNEIFRKSQRKVAFQIMIRNFNKERGTTLNPNDIDDPINCTQKCKYCKNITHSCHNENCLEPATSVCPNELCQAKMIIEYQQSQIKELQEIHKDELSSLKEDNAKKARLIDQYRHIMLKPADAAALVNKDAMNSQIMRIYCAQNKPFWEALANEKAKDGELSGEDIINEWIDGYHKVYTSLLEILHAKGLKVEIRKHIIEKRNQAIKEERIPTGKNTTPGISADITKKKAAPAESRPEWAKAGDGKQIYNIMKTYKCTKEEAEKQWAKMNS